MRIPLIVLGAIIGGGIAALVPVKKITVTPEPKPEPVPEPEPIKPIQEAA